LQRCSLYNSKLDRQAVASKEELIITALQQRIAELVADYELKMSVVRAELTMLAEEKNKNDLEKQKAIAEYSESLTNKIAGVE
jgi:hypothetical protein